MSETTLVQALAAAQAEMQNAAFDSKNNFSKNGKNNYASLISMREATVPVLSKHGIAVTQGEVMIEGHRYLRTRLHKNKETLEEHILMSVEKNNMHGNLSALTYARRYGIGAICGIASDEDDDGDEAVKAAPKHEYVTIDQVKEISSEIDRLGADRKKFLQHFKIGDLSQLSAMQYLQAMNMLEAKERQAITEAAAE